MDAATRDAITWTLGTVLTLCILSGLAVKFVLFPWLREHLLAPVQETARQVKENGHADEDNPTIPDRLADLSLQVAKATADHAGQARDLRALTRVLDEHLRWSNRWVDDVDEKLEKLENGDRQ